MRIHLTIPAIALFLPALPTMAAPAPFADLFNTGVSSPGVTLSDNSTDPHYTITAAPEGAFVGQSPLAATAGGGFPIGPWLGDNTSSAWITPRADTTGNLGDWTYRTTFTVPAGSDPATAFITGLGAADNDLKDVLLNGISIKNPSTSANPVLSGFDSFKAWSTTRGFVSGLNTLEFVLFEASGSAGAGGFTGLRVEMTGGVATTGRVAIPSLLNTGVSTMDGAALADNVTAAGWLGVAPGNVAFTPQAATSAQGFPIGPWLGDNGSSAWITPSADTNGAEGNYTYTTSFDLLGLDPSSAEIFGRWTSDNAGKDILLNGVSLGVTSAGNFGGWESFSITSGFVPGVNTLSFVIENGPGGGVGPTALRVEFDSASALPIPEPSATLLLLPLTALLLRRRR